MSEAKRAVEKAIKQMYVEYQRPFTIDELARNVNYSKYHFNRVFKKGTGITPAEYLSLVRIEKSKELLQRETWSIAQISSLVGYTSVSTYSRIFKKYAGVSPKKFRILYSEKLPPSESLMSEDHDSEHPFDSLRGTIHCPHFFNGIILIGLFKEEAPKGNPVACTIVRKPGDFIINDVPAGKYFAFAVGLQLKANIYNPDNSLRGKGEFPINSSDQKCRITLRPKLPTDPPISISLLYLLKNFIWKFHKGGNPG